MSESNEEPENHSSDEYQVQNEEWDESFRGTLHMSARSDRIASGVADPIQREAEHISLHKENVSSTRFMMKQ